MATATKPKYEEPKDPALLSKGTDELLKLRTPKANEELVRRLRNKRAKRAAKNGS